jgi:hypothetical protein
LAIYCEKNKSAKNVAHFGKFSFADELTLFYKPHKISLYTLEQIKSISIKIIQKHCEQTTTEIMLAYQQISHNLAGSRSPSQQQQQQSQEESYTQTMSTREQAYRREAFVYVRQNIKRSLSRSTSPTRSHSPIHTMSHTRGSSSERFLIKRSLSEEDLRATHDRRRLSLEQTEHHHHHAISHRPQILMNYHHRVIQVADDDADSDGENNNSNSNNNNNNNNNNSNNNNNEDENVKESQSEEQDEDAPLDLSMGSKKRRGRSDSGTDSDDSTGLGEEGRGNEGRAYKKSLMKRYCK